MFIAERRGFEPRIPFWSIHAFQACLFNHSSISPWLILQALRMACQCPRYFSAAKVVYFFVSRSILTVEGWIINVF